MPRPDRTLVRPGLVGVVIDFGTVSPDCRQSPLNGRGRIRFVGICDVSQRGEGSVKGLFALPETLVAAWSVRSLNPPR
jgi:hypothetical protein